MIPAKPAHLEPLHSQRSVPTLTSSKAVSPRSFFLFYVAVAWPLTHLWVLLSLAPCVLRLLPSPLFHLDYSGVLCSFDRIFNQILYVRICHDQMSVLPATSRLDNMIHWHHVGVNHKTKHAGSEDGRKGKSKSSAMRLGWRRENHSGKGCSFEPCLNGCNVTFRRKAGARGF